MKCNADIITLDYHLVCVKVIIVSTRGYALTTKLAANELYCCKWHLFLAVVFLLWVFLTFESDFQEKNCQANMLYRIRDYS